MSNLTTVLDAFQELEKVDLNSFFKSDMSFTILDKTLDLLNLCSRDDQITALTELYFSETYSHIPPKPKMYFANAKRFYDVSVLWVFKTCSLANIAFFSLTSVKQEKIEYLLQNPKYKTETIPKLYYLFDSVSREEFLNFLYKQNTSTETLIDIIVYHERKNAKKVASYITSLPKSLITKVRERLGIDDDVPDEWVLRTIGVKRL